MQISRTSNLKFTGKIEIIESDSSGKVTTYIDGENVRTESKEYPKDFSLRIFPQKPDAIKVKAENFLTKDKFTNNPECKPKASIAVSKEQIKEILEVFETAKTSAQKFILEKIGNIWKIYK